MLSPKIYGSPPEKKPDSTAGILDSAIKESQSLEHIKALLQLKAERVAEEEARERAGAEIKLRPDEIDVIVNIAIDLLSGHDPRELLGIKGTPGPRASPELLQYEYDVATYFWGLRLKNRVLAKKAAAEVSGACGISPLRVMKIARKHSNFVKGAFKANPNFNLLETSKALLSFNGALCKAEDKSTPIRRK